MVKNCVRFEEKEPILGERVYLDESAKLIGEVIVGDDVSIWPNAVLRGDVHRIEIGDRSNIQDGTIIHVTPGDADNPEGYPTIIGADVTIGHGVMLHGCKIGEGSLIGMRAIVMDGTVVEENAILGAGALLAPNKRVRRGEIWVGAPARRLKTMSEAEIAELYQSAEQYVTLKNRYLNDR